MKSVIHQRVQQYVNQSNQLPQSSNYTPPVGTDAAPTPEHAILLIGADRKIFSLNLLAAEILAVDANSVHGQFIDTIADGVLTAIALRQNATRATTLFEMDNERTIRATTRPVYGQDQAFCGWVVKLVEVDAAADSFSASEENIQPDLQSLLDNVAAMRELIAMLPQFDQNRYWSQLLLDHMKRLNSQMTHDVRRLAPDCNCG